jgi:hypothetical protein
LLHDFSDKGLQRACRTKKRSRQKKLFLVTIETRNKRLMADVEGENA